MGGKVVMLRKLSFVLALVGSLFVVGVVPVGASTVPSGERAFHQSGVEPVYNDETGTIGYLMVPGHSRMRANPRSWAPIYLPVYPTSAASSVGTLVCMHVPVENCPSHGNDIAGLAAQMMPDVYGAGVLGHDHMMDFPGGSDFNIAWEPIVVLFTSKAAANEHLTTDAALEAAVGRGDAIEVPLPQLTFYCAVVPKVIYDRATPVA
jgi:hypothetical protein